jgi:hypothetical protein
MRGSTSSLHRTQSFRDVLLPADRDFLVEKGFDYDVVSEAGLICVVIHAYPLPAGYTPDKTDLLLRLPPNFPDAQPDMYWCDPPVRVSASGAYPIAAELFEQHVGRQWQRFSRHLPAGAWQPGRDSLESYLALIRADLLRLVR